ncbi:class I SAM-dependent methyltransferase [Bacteroides xylanisolvens]|uniref:Methyltransferase domain protein n=1 Tax=Bacteroides eggerthii TaxID=28111 RepID=A0A975Q6N3_9BACE|nr:Methyltransferase domain protein [Bacteroides xylanisolvens]QUT35146.1 Methyltransferase domain protein [Bacteroides uniformis]QUT45847.1 Methyltransferase domain protein [Bacteroides eggerthii]
MKENKYDDNIFFQKYSQMSRSQQGLAGAGEWETLRKLLPDFKDKRVLDLGCGYGWHCIYAMEHGASSVVGVDISHKMLEVAKEKTHFPQVEYKCCAIEDVEFPEESFDVILSSLAFHYVADYEILVKKIYRILKSGGKLVFTVEHPVFTAYGTQDWHYICTFAMPCYDFRLFSNCNTKISEKSDTAKSWATFCCSGTYKLI